MLRILKVLIYLSVAPVLGQGNTFKMLEKKYSLDLDVESFPELKFNWNFDGKAQASVNAGLTELMDNKDHEKAFKHFDEAIVKLPSCLPAFYYRGICYKILGELPDAKDDLSKASALAPDRVEILLELGEVYELQRDYEPAEKLYEKAIALDPTFATAYFNMGNLSIRRNLLPRAARYFKQCLEVDPSFIKSHVRRGLLSYAMSGRGSKSLMHFDNALAVDSTYDAALFWRGMMYLRDRDIVNCLSDWNKLVRQNPGDPTFIFLRASLYLELMDYEKAFIDLKNIFSKSYDDENLFRGKQSSADQRLDLQFAVSYITRTIYGLNDKASSHLKNGFCFMVMEQRSDATREFKRSFQLQPSALSLFLSAINYEHSGKHDSAFYNYDEALKLDADIFDAHKKRAIYFAELKNWRSAYQDFEEMIRLEPQMKVTYRLRSMIRLEFKDYYGALLDLTRYIKIDSTDHDIYVYRAYCKNAVQDYKGANEDYRKAIEVSPEEDHLYNLLVTSDLQLSDTTHALETIAVSEKKFGVAPEMFSTKLRIYIHQKKFEEARSELKRITGDKFWLTIQGDQTQSLVYFFEGWLDFLENDEEGALRNLAKSLTFDQQNFEARYLRSKVYLSRGDDMKAINDLKALAKVGYSDSQTLLDQLR